MDKTWNIYPSVTNYMAQPTERFENFSIILRISPLTSSCYFLLKIVSFSKVKVNSDKIFSKPRKGYQKANKPNKETPI